MTAHTETNDAQLAPLRAALGERLAVPGEAGYDAAQPWNVAIAMRPRAVIDATTVDDIATTLRFAGEHGLRVAVQSTGHGATGIDDDAVLLVRTARLDAVEVDAASRIATIGAGAIWQQVIDAASPHQLAPLCGAAPGTGAIGTLTGGGIGPLVRTFGLSADYVVAFELVGGDGSRRRVTAADEDLYWALRGGKSALGIVTSVELELATLSELVGGAVYFDGADAAEVAHLWREWAPALPDHANSSLALMQLPAIPDVPPPLAGRFTVGVRFASTASIEDCEPLLAPLRQVASPLLDSVGQMPYAQIGMVHADPVEPMPAYEASTMLRELPAEAVDRLLEHSGPGSGSPQLIAEVRLLGGALADPAAPASAFSHRDAAFSLLLIGAPTPETAEAIAGHAETVIGALGAHTTGGRMPNFAPGGALRDGEHRYTQDALARLGAIARRCDPQRVMLDGFGM